jgi:hypothetical protein
MHIDEDHRGAAHIRGVAAFIAAEVERDGSLFCANRTTAAPAATTCARTTASNAGNNRLSAPLRRWRECWVRTLTTHNGRILRALRMTASGHEHEWAVRVPHVSFTLNCRTSPSTIRSAAWCQYRHRVIGFDPREWTITEVEKLAQRISRFQHEL